jgi:hypothetical protein
MTKVASSKAGGYPLVALFLVITACGIIASLIGPAARAISDGRIGVRDAISASLASTVVVMLIGGVIGLFHYRRARGFGWGLVTGAIIGIFVGPLVLAPHEAFGAVIALSFGGAAVIILITTAFRFASRK